MLQPTRTKFRKAHKGRIHGVASRCNFMNYGAFGLKAIQPDRVISKQIEAARVALTRHMKRQGRVWTRIFPNIPVSKKPIEVRMAHERDDVAIYRRKNGSIWEELPSISKDGEIFTLSEKAGYFKLGPKTIIVPEQTSIHQNYPNPFNPTTTIMYDIGLLDGLKQRVSISVYNLLGQHVTTLVENKDQIGQFKIQWNATDKFGQQMSSGVYFIQLSTKTGIVRNKKMMLLK